MTPLGYLKFLCACHLAGVDSVHMAQIHAAFDYWGETQV